VKNILRQILIVAFLLFGSISVLGNLTTKDLQQICKKKDYNNLIIKLNQLEERSQANNSVRWYMPQNRETTQGYYEQVFEVVQDIKEGNHTTVRTFKISFIRKGVKILFYNIKGPKTNKSGKTSFQFSYYTKRRLLMLTYHNMLYRKTYSHKLDKDKLFNLDNTFGYKCGSTIAKTYLTDSVESLTSSSEEKNLDILQNMLRDENIEIQMYAYYGFLKLKHLGYTLDFEQKHYMKLLENKDGTIAYCNITQNKQAAISEVILEINKMFD
jgi:hypothetical protein